MKNAYCWAMGLLLGLSAQAQPVVGTHQAPGAGNPLIPGYFADPTVKKFGDTYYLYATTDGNGGGFGPSQVWTSKDFVNWTNKSMNWPTTPYFWAPDVTQGKDGRYYLYYCQPTVEVYGASGATPTGPWTPLFADNQAVIKNNLVPHVITLDGQTFRDDDGKFYMFWGTWGIYPNSGCGIGQLNDDMKTFSRTDKLPNTIAKDFFEAPFMFKRKGIYYLTYSSGHCENETYQVQYVTSKTGPMGPFEFGKNNPILVTNADGSVHGPGHQSVIEHNGEYYLVYHRHNNPHNDGGFHRQICADKLVFDAEGNIEKVVPTHTGIGPLASLTETAPDLAYGHPVTTSSAYDADFRPEFAVDNNNGTLWKPKDNTSAAWLQIDLGTVQPVSRIHTQFEYATWYYQYLLEYSTDGRTWRVFADRRRNTQPGGPVIDAAPVKARYVRLTITDTQYTGLNKGVWNLKVYGTGLPTKQVEQPPVEAAHQPVKPKGLLLDLRADALPLGRWATGWPNRGKLGGTIDLASDRAPLVELVAGRPAFVFSGKEYFKSTVSGLPTLAGNSSWTAAMWVYNPTVGEEEPLLSWTQRGGRDLSNATIGYGSHRSWGAAAHWGWPDLGYKTLPKAGMWHYIAVTFDGTMERVYVDGKLDREARRMLFLNTDSPIFVGTNADRNVFFSGAISSVKLYDIALSESELSAQFMQKTTSPIQVSLDAARLSDGQPLLTIPNSGAAGGVFRAEKPVTVQAVGGKLAVVLPGGNPLSIKVPSPRQPSNESTVLVSYDGTAWHHTVTVRQSRQIMVYQDGQPAVPTVPVRAARGSQKSEETRHTVTGQTRLPAQPSGNASIFSMDNQKIASWQVYSQSLSAAEARALYTDWKATMRVLDRPGFARQPAATTPNSIDLEAALPAGQNEPLQYRFDELTSHSSSGWLDESAFTAYALQPDQRYRYTLTVRDAFGNVSSPTEPVTVETAARQFTTTRPALGATTDFLKTGTAGSDWDGLVGNHASETALRIASQAGHLRLESAGSVWDGGTPKGPFLYKTVTGDFVVQVEVADVSGQRERIASGANDAGLMVRLPQSEGSPAENLIQNSIFPGWNVGNLLSNLSPQGRIQTNNQSGWRFDQHLQVQRRGTLFHLRGSQDGQHWHDLPGSPISRPDWRDKPLQVGLFQATYGPQTGYGEFQNFTLIAPLN